MAVPRIAVVEDDPAVRQFLETLLADEGYDVVSWGGEAGAHAMIQRERPDLVVLDIRMEGSLAGLHVLESLRRDPATRDLPVIVCSADRRLLREQADHLRALHCVVQEKPFVIDDLLGKVIALVGPHSGQQ